MKRNIFGLMVFCIFLIIPHMAFAEEAPFDVGEPAVAGNGCPEGTYWVVLSPDGNELSVLFSSFTAKTDASTIYDYANCNIAIPIEVPAGITIGLLGIDYRGLAYIPTGGTGVISREHFFAGEQGDSLTSSINVYDQYYDFYYPDETDFEIWSECGDDIIARSNTTIFVSRPQNSAVDSLMTVFSEDWDVSIMFHLQWAECE
jgi:hypothetical protein